MLERLTEEFHVGVDPLEVLADWAESFTIIEVRLIPEANKGALPWRVVGRFVSHHGVWAVVDDNDLCVIPARALDRSVTRASAFLDGRQLVTIEDGAIVLLLGNVNMTELRSGFSTRPY